jgi:SlyX protein
MEDRIINLEIKFSHHDDFLEQLNQVVTEQQGLIERLQKELSDIKGQMNIGSVDPSRTLRDDVPPHY